MVKRACSFWVGMRGRIQVPLVSPTNQFGGPYFGSQGKNQVRLPSGPLYLPEYQSTYWGWPGEVQSR